MSVLAENGIINTYKKLRGTYPVSNEYIDEVLVNELVGIRMTVHPKYSGRIADHGVTRYSRTALGSIKIKEIIIGKQRTSNREELIDTLLHEELEARILLRNTKVHLRINKGSDVTRHEYINSCIKRYFRIKRWDYEKVR